MMWDFPKKWLGLVAIIGIVLFFFLENERAYRALGHYNGCSSERDREKVNRKYRIQSCRKNNCN